jgi:hypothetical protein
MSSGFRSSCYWTDWHWANTENILAAIFKILERAQLWVMIYLCVKFQKDPLYGLNLTFFAPWLPWQRLPF